MPYGYGFRGGWGFGFRGGSPPWPYVGLGRGGLPRCWYPDLWAYPQVPYPPFYPGGMPYYHTAPSYTQEHALDFLKEEAQAVRNELAEIERRIQELEVKEG